jgi:hypothetical protein
MKLKCVFHVSVTIPRTAETQCTPRLLVPDGDRVVEAAPRGTSHETWQRARGWSSED